MCTALLLLLAPQASAAQPVTDRLALPASDGGLPGRRRHGGVAKLDFDDDQYRRARQRGIVYNVVTRVDNDGLCQIRAAVRDVHTRQVGSASQFVEVPKVGAGKLVLPGVLLKGSRAPARN